MDKKTGASLVIIFLMVMSVLGLYAGNVQEENIVEYNGYRFFPVGTGWQVRVNDQQYLFQFLPEELQNFPLGNLPLGEKIYLAYDPTAKNITTDNAINFVGNLLRQFGSRAVISCIQEKGCPDELPIVDCETASAKVLYFRSAEEIGVIREKQCIIIQAPTSADLYHAVEKIGYQLLGVIKNE